MEALEEANQSKDEIEVFPAVKPHRQNTGSVESGITFPSIDSPLSLRDIEEHERKGAQPGARSKVKTSEPSGSKASRSTATRYNLRRKPAQTAKFEDHGSSTDVKPPKSTKSKFGSFLKKKVNKIKNVFVR